MMSDKKMYRVACTVVIPGLLDDKGNRTVDGGRMGYITEDDLNDAKDHFYSSYPDGHIHYYGEPEGDRWDYVFTQKGLNYLIRVRVIEIIEPGALVIPGHIEIKYSEYLR